MKKLQLDQHTSSHFNDDMEGIKTRVLEMGGLVEKQVTDALMAIEEADSGLAAEVIETEERVDEMEKLIDEAIAKLIALRQPAASDLRMVLGASKAVRDLERAGDEAQKIAKMAIKLSESGDSGKGYQEVRHIGDNVLKMIGKTLDAFARLDAAKALKTIKKDNKIDQDYSSAMREMITYMMEDPRSISRSLDVMWVLRSLERIADHAQNICEQVVYLVEGKDIRHSDNKK